MALACALLNFTLDWLFHNYEPRNSLAHPKIYLGPGAPLADKSLIAYPSDKMTDIQKYLSIQKFREPSLSPTLNLNLVRMARYVLL